MDTALATIQIKEQISISAPAETIEKMDIAAATCTSNAPTLEKILRNNEYPCNYCGDYEYCAGHWGGEECTGWAPAACIIHGIGPITDI